MILCKQPFARPGHMVRNKLCWGANNAVGLPKQRNSCQSSTSFTYSLTKLWNSLSSQVRLSSEANDFRIKLHDYSFLECVLQCTIVAFKMISAQHSSNNGKNQVTKKASQHGNIFNKGKRILSRFKLTSCPRER